MDRRDALCRLAGLVALGAAGTRLAGCSPRTAGTSEPAALRIPRADLVRDGRLRVTVAGHPIELIDRAGTVTGRSLLCTHFGCEVRWDDQAGEYLCPCHDGRFDAEGRPVAGPPKAPLRPAAVRAEGDTLVVEEPLAGESP